LPTNTQPPAPTPTSTPVSLIRPAAEIDAGTQDYLEKMVALRLFSGVVLIGRDGDIVFKKAYGLADRDGDVPNTPQTRFGVGSVTKQFTAMAILILQAQGKLEVEDPICTYLSNCPTAWGPVTIHHLLTHTSGIPGSVDAPAAGPDEIIAMSQDMPLDFEPASRQEYKDQNYSLMGQIIEHASGEAYAQFMQESIFEPLGMSDTGFECADASMAVPFNRTSQALFADLPEGYAAGGLCSTVEDLYRWDQALYTEQLVPQSLLEMMFTAYVAITPPSSEYTPWGYGYGWAVGMLGQHRVTEHPGAIRGYVALIARYPDDRVTTIVLSNQADLSIDPIEQQLARLVFSDL
jgi:CubicO group peptidase (beta-lactamase class C family)